MTDREVMGIVRRNLEAPIDSQMTIDKLRLLLGESMSRVAKCNSILNKRLDLVVAIEKGKESITNAYITMTKGASDVC